MRFMWTAENHIDDNDDDDDDDDDDDRRPIGPWTGSFLLPL